MDHFKLAPVTAVDIIILLYIGKNKISNKEISVIFHISPFWRLNQFLLF